MSQRELSKSKLVSWRQCPRRMWLEIHRPELAESEALAARFAAGAEVGAVARRLYDPGNEGTTVDRETDGVAAALARSRTLLDSSKPVFEAGLAGGGVLAFADVMLPIRGSSRRWRIIEVKSSTSVKNYHYEDAAIQAYAATSAGIRVSTVSVACVDSSWTYRDEGDYRGLLYETDITGEVRDLAQGIPAWIAAAQRVAGSDREPETSTGSHCAQPFPCPFRRHCDAGESQPEFPAAWLPRVMRRELRQAIAEGALDMRDVPDSLLNREQRRVKRQTLLGRASLCLDTAAAMLRAHGPPAFFMDFETVQFAVPVWPGTRPYQQIPFQFSVHRLSRSGDLSHHAFLDLSGRDPSEAFARELVEALGDRGPIFVYNAPFEQTCLRALGGRFPRLAPQLDAIGERIVDLLPVVRETYYHPDQRGSWSLKAVLPTIAPELDHASLDGVRDGGMAAAAYREVIEPGTSAERKKAIERELVSYCERDTLALVRIREFLLAPRTTP